MLTRLRSKLTYPYIASTLALFLALTGGAFALQGKNTVDSGDLKKNSVKSSDIAANAAKGGDVAEATLGQVPSAANADNATNAQTAQQANNAADADHADQADNATQANNAADADHADQADNAADADHADQADNSSTVNNVAVQGIRYVTNSTANNPTDIVNLGGLVLNANCNGGDVSLTADSQFDDAVLSSAAIDAASEVVDANTVHQNDCDDATLPIDLIPTDDNDQVLNIQYARPATFLGNPAATTVLLQVDDASATANCLVTGLAFRSGGGGIIIGPVFP